MVQISKSGAGWVNKVDCSQEGKAVKFEFMIRRFESFQSRLGGDDF